MLMQL
jgi:cyanate lyase